MAENVATLLKKNHFELDKIRKNSAIWFEQQAFLLMEHQNISARQALNGDAKKLKGKIELGKMYFFMYDAKHKDKLPYYDQFPLVLPFSPTKDGFIGLNLHYLPYDLRIRLLSNLQMFATSKNMSASTKLNFTWQTLSGMAKFEPAKACVKRYLLPQVRSQFRVVPADDWTTACMLPLEKFTGSSKFQVWTESLKK